MTVSRWVRVMVAGAIWALLYNLVWGLAWVAFMRRSWMAAAAAADQTMPWTPEFWAIWIPMTLPFGLAVAAYLLTRSERGKHNRDAVAASLVVWVPGTVGMAFGAALTPGIIVLDSFVNLVAVVVSSLALVHVVTRFQSEVT